jgi:2-isopropylmalate synthase
VALDASSSGIVACALQPACRIVTEASPAQTLLVYDWNTRRRRGRLTDRPVELYDETLRDGIQGPSIVDPTIEAKKRILELSAGLGIHCINLGLPGAGPRAVADVTALGAHLVEKQLPIRPSCAGRTHPADLSPIVEISQTLGIEIEVMAFLGASPVRKYVESWSLDHLAGLTRDAISFAVREGLPATFVVEDTTRSLPSDLDRLFRTAIDAGASRLCLCDTVGHATPDGVMGLISFVRDIVEASGADVGIDWHGHNDRGLSLTNTLTAIEAGVDRVHGTALGIGERVGNTPLDQLLVNLVLLGELEADLTGLPEWCARVSEATGWPIPHNYPVVGSDAFRTATGVHAAAVAKAERKCDVALSDLVYSGVPAALVGRRQRIDVGPMSGLANARHWLSAHGISEDEEAARSILDLAKRSDRTLEDEEILDHLRRLGAGGAASSGDSLGS